MNLGKSTMPLQDSRLQQLIEKNNIKQIDLKVADLQGRLHHITLPYSQHVMESITSEGVGFDGSSYGFQKVENSDMIMKPDLSSAQVDPFRTIPTITFFTHIYKTEGHNTPSPFDLRGMAAKAEGLLQKYHIADRSMWGPEFEFYIFEQARFKTDTKSAYFKVKAKQNYPQNGYHIINPYDLYDDFRDKAMQLMAEAGIDIKYHHHEVGKYGQQEIETNFDSIVATADKIFLSKYLLQNLAQQNGLALTFMPKPLAGQAGSGLHVHHYLLNGENNAFYEKSAEMHLNQNAQWYIGGILRHAPALCAFTNPSTNSYKRLVPGQEAPTAIDFGAANRTSCIRIPSYIKNSAKTRFEYRAADATANPYLFLSAILMAGLDGVINKIDPHKEVQGSTRFLPGDLKEALVALQNDHAFLQRDELFSTELINHWIKIKSEEERNLAGIPNPAEYSAYFDL